MGMISPDPAYYSFPCQLLTEPLLLLGNLLDPGGPAVSSRQKTWKVPTLTIKNPEFQIVVSFMKLTNTGREGNGAGSGFGGSILDSVDWEALINRQHLSCNLVEDRKSPGNVFQAEGRNRDSSWSWLSMN